MIDFYMAVTPNNHKIALFLEELEIPYKTHPIDLKANEQKKPEFLAMNSNGRTPVITDNEGPFGKKLTLAESGAILYYLSEKYEGRFLGRDLGQKAKVMQWVMFQMAGIGPMFGNYFYGKNMEPKNPQYVERFEKEVKRLIGVMNTELVNHSYIAGDEYTIADMVTYPWVAKFVMRSPELFENAPAVRRWMALVSERPAVKKTAETFLNS